MRVRNASLSIIHKPLLSFQVPSVLPLVPCDFVVAGRLQLMSGMIPISRPLKVLIAQTCRLLSVSTTRLHFDGSRRGDTEHDLCAVDY
jgi:hypothetical protein